MEMLARWFAALGPREQRAISPWVALKIQPAVIRLAAAEVARVSALTREDSWVAGLSRYQTCLVVWYPKILLQRFVVELAEAEEMNRARIQSICRCRGRVAE